MSFIRNRIALALPLEIVSSISASACVTAIKEIIFVSNFFIVSLSTPKTDKLPTTPSTPADINFKPPTSTADFSVPNTCNSDFKSPIWSVN